MPTQSLPTVASLRFSFLLVALSWCTCHSLHGQDEERQRSQPGSLTIGAYYYPWYRSRDKTEIGWMSKALRARLVPRQLPRPGVYDSRDPEVIGVHIAQSLRAGIDFWAVSWWGPRRREDRVFRENILEHPDAGKLKYAALYESTGRLGSFDKPDYSNLVSDFEYLKEHYFDHPAYLKIDGKPVVFIYLTRVYFRNRGDEPLEELRKVLPHLYLVGDEVFGSRYTEKHARLWDAITAYDVYGQSIQTDGATRAGIKRLHDNYANAGKLAKNVGTAFIPGIAPGYNDRAVREGHAGRARYFTDQDDSKEGDVFRAMIRDVAVPLADPKTNRTVMITSFNEWYEDTQIEATSGEAGTTSKDDSNSGTFYTEGDRYVDYGTLYLDILKEEKQASLNVETGGLSVLFRDNSESPKILSGLQSLFNVKDAPGFDAFDPDTAGASAGLNFEHIISGHKNPNNAFTPRNGTYKLRRLADGSVELMRRAEDSPWKVSSTLRYKVKEPHAIDFEFKCRFAEPELFGEHGTAIFFFANYMNDVADHALHFRGVPSAEGPEQWIRADAPPGHPHHNQGGTYRHKDSKDVTYDNDHNFNLNSWSYDYPRFTKPFYYGRAANDMAIILMFDRTHTDVDEIRFSLFKFKLKQFPRPAWDFQYIVRKPEKHKEFEFRGRLLWKKFVSPEDCLRDFQSWKEELPKCTSTGDFSSSSVSTCRRAYPSLPGHIA